ncbi:ATP-dependent DNA helicase UvrD2 [Cryptosporangium aurantiacum]|uniref:DNA 3'-5' helicase n=1 Tax=Cryptosporangium aurantiacum TaxID=134849 RepID=A0A1M7QNE4_9ACTN|nr:ATP-dependent DNA helicase UvrD2 [Cryptosporangium aurantiacum]SHN32881.1 ATP-dependent DNA helicase, Rep family [Cryptosporangium aurantiacum]
MTVTPAASVDSPPSRLVGPDAVLAGLDDEQRAAVLAPRGPVCILAGAGTGKTRAITHRIAHGVLTQATAPNHVLAVTFTARAAGEMRGRLRALGVAGVQARTFHAAALRQLRYFAPRVFDGRAMPELLETKARVVGQAAAREHVKLDRTGVRDLTSEIEWAKSAMVEPDGYPVAAGEASRETPLPVDQVAAVYAGYEQLKRRMGVIDFEDLLRATIWAIEDHRDVGDQIRAQYRHFVVDEYQDVNPLQQRLLEAWCGGRDDLTVVGDASQTIYSFTGANARYLIDFPRRHHGAVVIRLERDYRSTPQVVSLANEVIAAGQGVEASVRLQLVGQRPPGPKPRVSHYPDEPAEASAVATRCKELLRSGVSAAEIAVLFRTNAQSETYEQALADAGVPYVVRGGERFFERPEVREAMMLLRGAARAAESDAADGLPGSMVDAVTGALSGLDWRPDKPPAGGAARERWEALAALLRLAEEQVAADPFSAEAAVGLPRFVDELAARAAAQHVPTVEGVTLGSLHAAKGLEWDAVFLVGLAEGTLPISFAKTPAQLEEERRLLYVGVTRAREHVWLSWAAARSPGGRGSRRPCRFLPAGSLPAGVPGTAVAPAPKPAGRSASRSLPTCRICGVALFDPTHRKLRRCGSCPANYDEELFERLRTWRGALAKEQKLPPYVVFTDATLTAVAELQPSSEAQLAEIAGVGPRKLTLYGEALLALVAGADPASLVEPTELA